MLISQAVEEIRLAFSVQSHCTLEDIRLSHCHVSLENYEENLKSPFRIRLSKPTTHASLLSHSSLRVRATFAVEGQDSSKSPKSLFKVECSFDLNYSIQSDFRPGEAELKAFKDGNAIFNCWPYVREFVQNLTMRMDLDAPPLPLLRIAPKPPLETNVLAAVTQRKTAPRQKKRIRGVKGN